jgi:GDP-4-dehydro-6-deoxy-D-mannose reductase
MRVLVTGASGFVGPWLDQELRGSGHQVVALPRATDLDIADQVAVRSAVAGADPAAIVHLAAMAFGPDATADPAEAIRVNVGGTLAVVEAVRLAAPDAALLVVGSSEVYAADPPNAPLRESSPLAPRGVYGLTKLAAESLALGAAAEHGLKIAVARAFNHTGPGQRPEFVVPALARRILAAREVRERTIRVGNVDVARDIGDVRDVVRAYRLLLEALADNRVPGEHRVYNVATGTATSIREVIERLSVLASWPVEIERDVALVRPNDPASIVGDAAALRSLTGWSPGFGLAQTLSDVLGSLT